MKTIKLLLIISQMVVSVQIASAQAMMSDVSYMYLSRDVLNMRKYFFVETYSLKDTNFEFVVIRNESMLVNGNKVYHKINISPNKVDTILI